MVKLPPLAPFCLDREDRSFCVVSDVDAVGGDVNLTYEQVCAIISRARVHDALVKAITAIHDITGSPANLGVIAAICREALEKVQTTEREFQPDIQPCDDAEFGMQP